MVFVLPSTGRKLINVINRDLSLHIAKIKCGLQVIRAKMVLIFKFLSVYGAFNSKLFNLNCRHGNIMFMLLGLGLMLATFPTTADDLLSVYRQALEADPATRSAETKIKIGEAQRKQAFGQILPQVTATANWSTNSQQAGNFPTNNYTGTRYFISLNQTVIDLAKYWAWHKSKEVENQYSLENQLAEQNLLYEVTDKYFSVLEAEDELELYRIEAEITQKEVEQIQHQFEKQLVKVTDLYAIQARLDQVNAAAVEAEAKMATAKQTLRELTDAEPVDLAKLKDNIEYQELTGRLDDWLEVARSENPAVVAQGYALAAAGDEVEQQQSGHYPVVELQLNYYNTDTGFQSTRTNLTETQVAAININTPIFSGGTQHQRVQEAKHRLTLNKLESETKLRELNRVTSDAFLNTNASVRRIKANGKALESSAKSREAIVTGYYYGVQTLNDVLKAQDEEFRALQELSKAKYAYVKNRMRFLQAIGSISEDNLREVNAWLQPASTVKPSITALPKQP